MPASPKTGSALAAPVEVAVADAVEVAVDVAVAESVMEPADLNEDARAVISE